MTATNCNMMSYDLLFVGDIRIALRAEKKKPCAQMRAEKKKPCAQMCAEKKKPCAQMCAEKKKPCAQTRAGQCFLIQF